MLYATDSLRHRVRRQPHGLDDVTVSLACLGTTFSVVTESDGARRAVTDLWRRCMVNAVDGPHVEVVFHQPGDEDDRALLTQLTTQAIAHASGRYLMMHAAGVADEQGRVLALVGRSGSGKTTSAVLLSRDHGFGYVTDETVAVQSDRAVPPFPRPLAVLDRESGVKTVKSPDELGLREATGAAQLARIVLLDRQDELWVDSRFDQLDLLSGISELIPQLSALPSLDRPLQRLADLIDRCGGVYRLSFSGIGDAEAQAIRDFLDAELEAKDLWQPLERPADDDVVRNLGLRDMRFRRGGALDGIRVGDEALVMVGATPIRLSGLGVTIWEAAADAPTFEELVDRVVEEHGPHPEAESLVREAVDSMVEAKLLGFGAPITVQQFLASMAPQLPVASDDACCGGA